MQVKIEESWGRRLSQEFTKPYFAELAAFVRKEYASGVCYPPGGKIFNAFAQTPFDQVKVVILGQDPYHEAGQAMGLSFSVPEGVALPPSLRNIYAEIQRELSIVPPASGDLTRWARQGVLLLNATLTVRQGQAASHQRRGWEIFTDAAIQALAREREHIVFLLWGAYAGQKAQYIDPQRHLVLRSAHPSPLSASRGFFDNHHFQLCNDYLIKNGLTPIRW
ncbi:MAG: uracil-DNA glycosylase [Bacteroidales bacterium]|nr:uracil-DNA glycosylase [Bacteroidales bacterium]